MSSTSAGQATVPPPTQDSYIPPYGANGDQHGSSGKGWLWFMIGLILGLPLGGGLFYLAQEEGYIDSSTRGVATPPMADYVLTNTDVLNWCISEYGACHDYVFEESSPGVFSFVQWDYTIPDCVELKLPPGFQVITNQPVYGRDSGTVREGPGVHAICIGESVRETPVN